MHEYGKTENLFTRNPETHKLNLGEFRAPEYEQIGHWLVTEKVDGTNVRVLLRYLNDDNEGTLSMEVRGRSDRATVPGDLKDGILYTLDVNKQGVFALLEELTGNDPQVTVCLYGEGYGAGIQKGRMYREDKWLRIFDVLTTKVDAEAPYYPASVTTWWRDWATVEKAAAYTGLQTVPVLEYAAGLDTIVFEVTCGFNSQVALEDGGDVDRLAEGVVARTDPYLYDWRGHRVFFKLKSRDL